MSLTRVWAVLGEQTMTYMLQGGLTSKPSEVLSKVLGTSTHRRRE